MHKTLRRLPSLDFLRGFEAAGRRLSFTLAAEELFVTQSALSRQVKALEDALGVAAVRAPATARSRSRRRAPRSTARSPRSCAISPPPPTPCGPSSRRRASPCRRPCRSRRCGSSRGCPRFAPRIRPSTSTCPPTIASSTWRAATSTSPSATSPTTRAPRGAVRLFGERLLPVASPALVKRGPPLKRPADLARHVLLHLDDPGRPDAVAQLAGVAHRQRRAGPEAGGGDPLLAVRPGDPGDGRRAGRGARAHSADRRAARATAASSRRSPSATTRRAATSRSSRRTRRSGPRRIAFVEWLRGQTGRGDDRPRTARKARQ